MVSDGVMLPEHARAAAVLLTQVSGGNVSEVEKTLENVSDSLLHAVFAWATERATGNFTYFSPDEVTLPVDVAFRIYLYLDTTIPANLALLDCLIPVTKHYQRIR